MRNIGIYSGTFDPIHRGHVDFAIEAMRECGLDEVILLPERQPRHKNNVTDISHRFTMISEVLSSIQNLRVLELDQARFSVDETLPTLHEFFPDAHLTILIGSDVARNLEKWESLELLIRDVSFAIGIRDDDDIEEIISIIESLEQKYKSIIRYSIIDTDSMAISSSRIRLDTSHSLDFHATTLDYIRKNSLYS